MKNPFMTVGSALYWVIVIAAGIACYRMMWQIFSSPVSAFSRGLTELLK